jgi:hypothetical protein
VHKFLEGAIANNVNHLGAVLTADFVFDFGAGSVLAGSHRGIEGLSRLFTKYDEILAETVEHQSGIRRPIRGVPDSPRDSKTPRSQT